MTRADLIAAVLADPAALYAVCDGACVAGPWEEMCVGDIRALVRRWPMWPRRAEGHGLAASVTVYPGGRIEVMNHVSVESVDAGKESEDARLRRLGVLLVEG